MLTKKQRRAIRERAVRFVKYRLVRVDDSPHRIAFGVAMGLFVAYLPPLGLHILLSFALAFILGANKIVAVTFTCVNNPLTIIPIYYPCCLLGRFVLGLFGVDSQRTLQEVFTFFAENLSPARIVTGFYTPEFWHQMKVCFVQIGFEMLTGGLIIGTIIGTASYFATKKLIEHHRKKRPRQGQSLHKR